MFKKVENQYYIEDFILPFEGKLRADNRWIQLAKLIPWQKLEEHYANLFTSNRGQLAKPVRMALGALIIKEKCGFTDRETVEQITENPYLQYFIGLEKFQDQPPFDPSLMVHFRKRLGTKVLNEVNEEIIKESQKEQENDDNDDSNNDSGDGGTSEPPPSGSNKGAPPESKDEESKSNFKTYPVNQGKIILDATCAPVDIHYPTDLFLLNEARLKLDKIIDTVHRNLGKPSKRPRTYRQKAHQAYLKAAKNKNPGKKGYKKAIDKQLRYVRRNLNAVDRLLDRAGEIHGLSKKQQEMLETIRELYKQQHYMYKNRTHKVKDRIVSINQPHVRPIVRGKAAADVEFGAKVAISVVNGYTSIETLSWDPFNESTTLIDSVENYFKKYGHYPEVVQADKIYRTRANIQYCEERGIRLSGPKLGKPPADKEVRKAQKQLERQDSRERNAVEGKFGEGKRRYGLARIMARLKETSESEICLQFLVMNLERRLRVLFFLFLGHMWHVLQHNFVFIRPSLCGINQK